MTTDRDNNSPTVCNRFIYSFLSRVARPGMHLCPSVTHMIANFYHLNVVFCRQNTVAKFRLVTSAGRGRLYRWDMKNLRFSVDVCLYIAYRILLQESHAICAAAQFASCDAQFRNRACAICEFLT